jgi:hypothetical protein
MTIISKEKRKLKQILHLLNKQMSYANIISGYPVYIVTKVNFLCQQLHIGSPSFDCSINACFAGLIKQARGHPPAERRAQKTSCGYE